MKEYRREKFERRVSKETGKGNRKRGAGERGKRGERRWRFSFRMG